MAFDLTKGTWFQEVSKEQGYLVFEPRFIREATIFGITFGTADFVVYQYLRWCEEEGKFGIMVAGYEHIQERFGFDKSEDVRNVLNHLSRMGAVNHIWSNTKIYRSKTKIWVSTIRMRTMGSVDQPTNFIDPPTNFVDTPTNATPVLTPVGNNNIKEKKERPLAADAASGTPSEAGASSRPSASTRPTPKEEEVLSSFPFDEEVKVVDVNQQKYRQTANAKAGVAVNKMCDVLGRDKRGQNVAVANAKKMLDKGYTVDELVGLAEWAKKSDFYKDKPIHTLLGNDAMQQYQIDKNNKNDKGVVKGFSL